MAQKTNLRKQSGYNYAHDEFTIRGKSLETLTMEYQTGMSMDSDPFDDGIKKFVLEKQNVSN